MKICVHNGSFHADDVLCIALAHIEYPNEKIEVIRTRDENEFQIADFVMDVGLQYGGKYYDHHQENVPVYENGIKYAACGLFLESMKLNANEKQYLLENGLYAVQAQDNGQDINLRKYPNPFTFISTYNCDWKTGVYGKEQDKVFEAVVVIAYSILNCLLRNARLEEEANQQVNNAISKTKDNFIFIGNYCPWVKPVLQYNNNEGKIKAVVYKNSKGEYQCQVVPKKQDSFEAWCAIPENVVELDGFIFRHKAAFLAGFTNYESAMECARRTVNH